MAELATQRPCPQADCPRPAAAAGAWLRRIPAALALTLAVWAPSALHAAGEDLHTGKSSGPMVVLPPAAAPAGGPPVRAGLHLPGREYRAGSGWWLLACRATCELVPAAMAVSARLHPQYDGDPVPGQWLQFDPPTVPGALLAFKPFRAPADRLVLRAGPVTTWHPGVTARLKRPAQTPGTMEGEIALPDGRALRLVPTLLQTVTPRPLSDGGPELALDLVLDGRRQQLGVFAFGINGPVAMKPADYLRWAGDLDGDGQPDLLVSLDFSGGTHLALYLSSLARPGELVGEAGRFVYFPIDIAGC